MIIYAEEPPESIRKLEQIYRLLVKLVKKHKIEKDKMIVPVIKELIPTLEQMFKRNENFDDGEYLLAVDQLV